MLSTLGDTSLGKKKRLIRQIPRNIKQIYKNGTEEIVHLNSL